MIRYTPESSDDPEHRQSLASEVWQSVKRQLGPGDKITLLTSGPLTNLANISLSDSECKLCDRAQRKAASFESVLEALEQTQQTPESVFVQELFIIEGTSEQEKLYHHVDIFLGEVLGAVYMVQRSDLKSTVMLKGISVVANTMKSTDGQIVISNQSTKLVHVLSDFNGEIYYELLANSLANKKQSAIIASFEEQKAIWSRPPDNSGPKHTNSYSSTAKKD
ncbi:hypothetical protein D1007_32748 [Hordeum vulgare]|nr:hypothetical protein D1007_32748 [Hordeum vulgare]